MEFYVGMDVSLKETSICVVDGSGEIVSEGTVISEPSAIAAFIEAKAVSALRIGLETGPTTTWLWHELRALGFPVICIDARHAKAGRTEIIHPWDDRMSGRCQIPLGAPVCAGSLAISPVAASVIVLFVQCAGQRVVILLLVLVVHHVWKNGGNR